MKVELSTEQCVGIATLMQVSCYTSLCSPVVLLSELPKDVVPEFTDKFTDTVSFQSCCTWFDVLSY